MKFQLYRRFIFPDYNYKYGPLNILEDARYWIGLLQYNLSITGCTVLQHITCTVCTISRLNRDNVIKFAFFGEMYSHIVKQTYLRLRHILCKNSTFKLKTNTFLAIYGPMIYTAPCVMLLMWATPLRGQVGGGWALEIKNFMGPVK